MMNPSSTSVTVVIPVFNERGRLINVLKAVCLVQELAEIIVVDDGSTDHTELDLQELSPCDSRIRYIKLETNQGKSRALQTGVNNANSELIVFLDADLNGLTPRHVLDLIRPVRDGLADLTIGLFHGGRWHTDLSQQITPWMSGQRCLPRRLFFQVPIEQVVGYGIETAFTLIAHQQNWRIKYVKLQGAYHTSLEFRRRHLTGLIMKARMFFQMYKTYWNIMHQNQRTSSRMTILALVMLVVTLIALSMPYGRSRANSTIHLQDLPFINWDGAKRLLVIAPHPDDETLGTGGAIQSALSNGIQVRVLVFTNGDGQVVVPISMQKELIPGPQDFIRHGEIRQQESLNALSLLGVPTKDAIYLGFPDRQLSKLWLDDWQHNCPLRGEFTHTTQVPYANVYRPAADYCGRTVLEIVKNILAEYRPDIILLPHLNDDHPDHRAASQFTLLAAAELAVQDTNYKPTIWGYLIHSGNYPSIRGWHLNKSLLPPISLAVPEAVWARLDLTPEQEALKAQAINAYLSQMKVMKSFLESFDRQDEIFQSIHWFEISRSLGPITYLSQVSELNMTSLPKPSTESARRLVMTSTDLVGVRVDVVNNQLVLTAQTRGEILPVLRYLIQFKFTDGSTKTCSMAQDGQRLSQTSYACTLDISQLPTPTVVGFEAEVAQEITLDRSGWHFIIFR